MLLKISFTIFSAMILSCGTSGKQSQDTQTTTTTETSTSTETTTKAMEEKGMMAEGFLLGTVVYSTAEDDCPYTVKLKRDNGEIYYVDPINMDKEFMVDKEEIWIKYSGLGRMNRCIKANPVSISEIQKRAE